MNRACEVTTARKRRLSSVVWTLVGLSAVLGPSTAPSYVAAQQTTVQAPLNIVSDSFYEMFGINWGFTRSWSNGSLFFNNGGFGGTVPQFGGYDPNSAARFGFGTGGPGGNFYFNFIAAQGSNRSMITHAPVLTLPNGGVGSVSDSSYLPFVTGIVPVVGDGSRFGVGPVGPPPVRTMSPLAERLRRLEQGERGGVRPIMRPRGAGSSSSTIATVSANSPLTAGPAIGTAAARSNSSGEASLALNGGGGGRSSGGGASTVSTAERGDLSVAEIRRQQAAADEALAKEITDLIAEARQLEEAGRPGQARIYYQRAATRATGDQLRELKTKIAELERLAKRK